MQEDLELEKQDALARSSNRSQAIAWEEEERQSRIQDSIGSEEYKQLLANKVSASIAKDILTPSLKIQLAAGNLVAAAKQASQGFISGAGDFAYRAAHFFGAKASAQAHALTDKAQSLKAQAADKAYEQVHNFTEKVSDLSNKAYEQAQALSGQVAQKTSEQVYDLTSKVQNLTFQAADQAQVLRTQVADKAQETLNQINEGAQNLGAQVQGGFREVIGNVQEFSDKAIHFGTQSYEDAVYMLTISKLNYLEETERLWRTTTGLTVERFLLALKVSSMVKDFIIAYDRSYNEEDEPNRWYATSILEDFERTRRLVESNDKTALRNAKRVAHIVHLRNIQTTSYRPQPAQIKKVSEVLAKKAEATVSAAPQRAMAAM